MNLDSKEFMTGIEAIDKGHRQLIALINKILDFQLNNLEYDYKAVKQCLNDVVVYSIEHLDIEEEIMRSVEYPDYILHLEKHNVFRNEINIVIEDLASSITKNADTLIDQISEVLINWLRSELLADDINLASYLKKKSFHR